MKGAVSLQKVSYESWKECRVSSAFSDLPAFFGKKSQMASQYVKTVMAASTESWDMQIKSCLTSYKSVNTLEAEIWVRHR
jgi:hypothetical protein